MAKSLKVLDRVKKWEIDEQRKILSEFFNAEIEIEKAIEEKKNQYEDEKKFISENVDVNGFGEYTKKHLRDLARLNQMLLEVRMKIEILQDLIADMFKEQKTYNIIDDNRAKRQQMKETLEEQKFLDEIGTNKYIENNKKN